jgi:hypothetical protein
VLRLALLSSLSAAVPLLAAGDTATSESEQAHASYQTASAKFVQLVRDATRQFIDVNAATAAGYQPFLGASAVRITGPCASTTSTAIWSVMARSMIHSGHPLAWPDKGDTSSSNRGDPETASCACWLFPDHEVYQSETNTGEARAVVDADGVATGVSQSSAL